MKNMFTKQLTNKTVNFDLNDLKDDINKFTKLKRATFNTKENKTNQLRLINEILIKVTNKLEELDLIRTKKGRERLDPDFEKFFRKSDLCNFDFLWELEDFIKNFRREDKMIFGYLQNPNQNQKRVDDIQFGNLMSQLGLVNKCINTDLNRLSLF